MTFLVSDGFLDNIRAQTFPSQRSCHFAGNVAAVATTAASVRAYEAMPAPLWFNTEAPSMRMAGFSTNAPLRNFRASLGERARL